MHSAASRHSRQAVETDLLFGLDAVVLGSGGNSSDVAPLHALEIQHAAECVHCTSATDHTNLVFGEGASDATIMFIGEAPGETEDRLGRPFVGPAGQKLDAMISAMGLERSDVYITNILKARPSGNRTPLAGEAEACGEWLLRQIAIVEPTVIVALGGPAAKFLLKTEVGITRLRGAWHEIEVDGATIALMPTFHPAYLLRQYTPEIRGQIWSDLQAVMERAVP